LHEEELAKQEREIIESLEREEREKTGSGNHIFKRQRHEISTHFMSSSNFCLRPLSSGLPILAVIIFLI
jgi:hypothetical protein